MAKPMFFRFNPDSTLDAEPNRDEFREALNSFYEPVNSLTTAFQITFAISEMPEIGRAAGGGSEDGAADP